MGTVELNKGYYCITFIGAFAQGFKSENKEN